MLAYAAATAFGATCASFFMFANTRSITFYASVFNASMSTETVLAALSTCLFAYSMRAYTRTFTVFTLESITAMRTMLADVFRFRFRHDRIINLMVYCGGF